MTPLGLSGGSQDRLSVSAVDLIRWTVGTAEGAAAGGANRDKADILAFCAALEAAEVRQ